MADHAPKWVFLLGIWLIFGGMVLGCFMQMIEVAGRQGGGRSAVAETVLSLLGVLFGIGVLIVATRRFYLQRRAARGM